MAATKKEVKNVRLAAPNGVKVSVREDKVERLAKRGFKRVGGRPAKTEA